MNDEDLEKLFAYGDLQHTDEQWSLFRGYVERWELERLAEWKSSHEEFQKKHPNLLVQAACVPNRLTPKILEWIENRLEEESRRADVKEGKSDREAQRADDLQTRLDQERMERHKERNNLAQGLFEPPFKAPLFDILKFGQQQGRLNVYPPNIKVRHITDLAWELAGHTRPLCLAATALPQYAYLFRGIGSQLLRNQFKNLVWVEHLFWVIRIPKNFEYTNSKTLDTLCESLLATAIRYRLFEDSSYSRSMITLGLAWCCECIRFEGGINIHTKVPELDVDKVNQEVMTTT